MTGEPARDVRLVLLLVCVLAAPLCRGQPAASPLPNDNPRSEPSRRALLAMRDRLRAPPPPVTAREQSECADWMLKANPEIKHVLIGHHVIVMATEGFAARARASGFLLNADLSYEVLVHLWGVDPSARVGRRFFIWPDPGRPGGHNCNGRDLRIAIGRSDWDNAEWIERFIHEMTHGFQFEHPAGHLMINGFFEGWAEFMPGVVCDHLAPLGKPFTGRFEWCSTHFPASARQEYLQTRLPIEEIVQYDPASGLMMEMVNATKSADQHPDWGPLRKLLQSPIVTPRYVPWHLWPALAAREYESAFGAAAARPILAKYRFPLDAPSLDAAAAQNSGRPRPDGSPRAPVAKESGWLCAGPFPNPTRLGLESDPLDAEDIAWRWREAPDPRAEPSCADRPVQWRRVFAGADNVVQLDGESGAPAYFYLAATLPSDLRAPLTLFISSDDECAVWLDGRLVHFYRGTRACTPDFPDVAYADATDGAGRIVVLVMNHGGRGAFSMAAASGGLLFSGFEQRMASPDPSERGAAVAYVASRRFRQPVERLLERAAKDQDASVRAQAGWWPDKRPSGPGEYVEAEDAYFRGSIAGGFFGNNLGSSGNQCVARGWGTVKENWLSLPLAATSDGPQRVRIRYACPNESSLRVRLRRGERVVTTTDAVALPKTGKDWNAWRWHDVPIPRLERGVYHVELIEPAGGMDIDMLGLAPAGR